MKNPFLKVPIEEIVERKGKGKLSFDVKKMTVKINFKSTEFATIDSSEYTLTNDISKLDSDDMSIFIFESISTGKDATKGKMKLELLNTKYTGDSKTVFVFESEYLVILYRGKRAEVTFD